MPQPSAPIYHLIPASIYRTHPPEQPYLPANFAAEGFIHCTAGLEVLVQVANAYFASLEDELLVLEIDPARLTAPLKFEPPVPPPGQPAAAGHQADILFPHIYGPLNPEAVVGYFALLRPAEGGWRLPE